MADGPARGRGTRPSRMASSAGLGWGTASVVRVVVGRLSIGSGRGSGPGSPRRRRSRHAAWARARKASTSWRRPSTCWSRACCADETSPAAVDEDAAAPASAEMESLTLRVWATSSRAGPRLGNNRRWNVRATIPGTRNHRGGGVRAGHRHPGVGWPRVRSISRWANRRRGLSGRDDETGLSVRGAGR